MFINVDYHKRIIEGHYYLAKPNRQVIASIPEAMEDSLDFKSGEINELNFSIPYYIEEDFEMVENPNIERIKERMLIKAVLGSQVEWFLVDSIKEDGDDSEVFNVSCFSLGYELSGKRIATFETESANADEIIKEALKGTAWKLRSIDEKFLEMYRSFSMTSTNALEVVIEVSNAFNGLIIWHSEDRSFSLVDAKDYSSFKGMTVEHGRLMSSVGVERKSENLVTRLYVEGAEGLSIQSVNPTGQNYIEDFSYFMHPFKQDAFGKVLQSSYFMSDDLCLAILEQKKLITNNATKISQLISDGAAKRAEIAIEESNYTQLYLELDTILNLLDVAKSTGDAALIAKRTTEMNQKSAQVSAKKALVDKLRNEYIQIELTLTNIYTAINRESNFTTELIEELKLFTLEKEWVDDRYIDAKELYEEALIKFEEFKEPVITLDVDVVNFLEMVEESYYWDKLILGDLIKIRHDRLKLDYFARITGISFDFGSNSINITISNAVRSDDADRQFNEIIRKSESASTILSNSKYKWDDTNKRMSEVELMINGEFDASKRKILAGIDNNIEIGKRGIIIRNPQFPQEVIVIQSGIMALSKNDGKDWQTAITPDGIVAERLMGRIIAGQNLLITNQAGSFVFDNQGVRIDADSFIVRSGTDKNLIDEWTQAKTFTDEIQDDGMVTGYEKNLILSEWNKIKSRYEANLEVLNDYYGVEGVTIPVYITYRERYVALFDYLFNEPNGGDRPLLDPSIINKTSLVDKVKYDKVFNDLLVSESGMQKMLIQKAKDFSDEAKRLAEEAQNNIDEVKNDVVYKIEITSSQGFIFKNGQFETTLTAKVFRGKADITNTIPTSGFKWTKRDHLGNLDTVWNKTNATKGKEVVITRNDVSQKATFQCDIDI